MDSDWRIYMIWIDVYVIFVFGWVRSVDLYIDIILGYVNSIWIFDGGIYLDGMKVVIIWTFNIFGRKLKILKVCGLFVSCFFFDDVRDDLKLCLLFYGYIENFFSFMERLLKLF